MVDTHPHSRTPDKPRAQQSELGRARHVTRVRAALSATVGAILVALILVACTGPGNQNQPPEPPAAVSANPIPGGVRVVWTDKSSNEDEFIIFRAVASGDEGEVEFTEVHRVPTDGTSYEDFDVDMAGSYSYAVAASNRFGLSDQVVQDPAEPVSPGVGVRLTVSFDGVGAVDVLNGGQTVTCTSQCVLGVALGSSVTLTATGAQGLAFSGWAGACSMAGSCTFTIADDTDVVARFSKLALHFKNTGDSPVSADIRTPDVFGNNECIIDAGQSCAFGFDFDGVFQVGVVSTRLEPQAEFLGYGGACTSVTTYCLVDVVGETTVTLNVVRAPVAGAKVYPGREDTVLHVTADDGLLVGVVDSSDDSHEALVVSDPATGTLNLAADGSFEYQPAQHANGQMSFEFAVRDAYGNESAPQTATLNVAAVNDAPMFELADDPPGTPGQGQTVTVPGFATGLHPGGGSDEAGQTLAFKITLEGPPGQAVASNVSLTIDPGGSTATLSYTARNNAMGTSMFHVNLQDDGDTANGGSDTSAARSFTITATPVRLTLSATTGGNLVPAVGVHEYGYGSEVSVTASAAANYQFAGWTGACTNDSNPCQLVMNGNRTLSASFSPFVRARPSGGLVYVASDPPGIANCTPFFGTCDYPFPTGTPVTLSFTEPRTVSGVTCTQASPTNTCTFTVSGPVTVNIDPPTSP